MATKRVEVTLTPTPKLYVEIEIDDDAPDELFEQLVEDALEEVNHGELGMDCYLAEYAVTNSYEVTDVEVLP